MRLLVALLVVAVYCGNAATRDLHVPTSTAPIMPVPHPVMEHQLFWIDNGSLLFRGYAPEPNGSADSRSEPRLYSWNIKTDAIRNLDRSPAWFCYFKGRLEYVSAQTDEEVVVRKGTLDGTRETRLPKREFGTDGQYVRSPFDCRYVLRSSLRGLANCAISLRPGDGYIDLTGGNCDAETQARRRDLATLSPAERRSELEKLQRELADRPARYLRTLDSPPMNLPIKSRQFYTFGSDLMRFSEWSREYILPADQSLSQSMPGFWPEGEARPIYFLKGGVVVRRVEMPYAAWNRGRIAAAVATRRGLVVVNHNVSVHGGVSSEGIYLLEGNQAHRIDSSYVRAIEASPDGCRIAAIVQDAHARSYGGWLKVFELCGSA